MSTKPPPAKKAKAAGGSATSTTSWRAKSIDKFDLQPVPSAWADSVAIGSEQAWKRYYVYRLSQEKSDARNKSDDDDRYDSDGNSIANSDDECNWEKEALEYVIYSWAESDLDGMEAKKALMVDGCKWSWTPQTPSLQWEDENRLRSAEYTSHVWSPYAIPHAIKLSHEWSGKMRYSGYDLATDWSYLLKDFEEEVDTGGNGPHFVELCSHNYDKIDTSNLNATTCRKLRKFLYGSNSKESEEVTCSDRDFWFLLFGSMGSTDKDLMEDAKDATLGYSWCPWKVEGMKKRLFDAKAPANDDPNGEPPTTLDKYNPRWCSWLRYRILEVTDSLGPISRHYQPPSAKKDDDSCSSDGYGDY